MSGPVHILDEEMKVFLRGARHLTRSQVDDAVGHVFPASSAVAHDPSSRARGGSRCRWLFVGLMLILLVLTVTWSTERGQRVILSYTQDLVYPVMRLVRLLFLPLTRAYGLSTYHEDQCLVENPLYREPSVDCWPCSQVSTVLDLTGLANFSTSYYNGGVPFIIRDSLYSEVTYELLQRLYSEYPALLEAGTARFLTNLPHISSLAHFFQSKAVLDERHLRVYWQPRRVPANRVLRTVFPRPGLVPAASEVSLEKFVHIDGHQASSYSLPLTEFSNVFVVQGCGARTMALQPVQGCEHTCSPVMLTLNTRELLYYNQQYWRPVSRPVQGRNNNINPAQAVSLTYIGSFY